MRAPKPRDQPNTVFLNELELEQVESQSGPPELRICPRPMVPQRVNRRSSIAGRPECRETSPQVKRPDSIVQLKIVEDSMPGGFLPGVTLQDSETVSGLRRVECTEADREGASPDAQVTALLNEGAGLRVCQILEPTAVGGTLRA